jgi:hypothetical protein
MRYRMGVFLKRRERNGGWRMGKEIKRMAAVFFDGMTAFAYPFFASPVNPWRRPPVSRRRRTVAKPDVSRHFAAVGRYLSDVSSRFEESRQ